MSTVCTSWQAIARSHLGLYMAAREVRAGVRDEYEQLQAAAAEERALGRHPLRGFAQYLLGCLVRAISASVFFDTRHRQLCVQ